MAFSTTAFSTHSTTAPRGNVAMDSSTRQLSQFGLRGSECAGQVGWMPPSQDSVRAAPYRANRLFDCLPDDEREQLLMQSELVALKRGEVLVHATQRPRHLYFPGTATLSLMHSTPAGQTCEVAMVGNEGMVGIHMLMGAACACHPVVVKTPGIARRISPSALLQVCPLGSEAGSRLLRYAQLLMVQMSQNAVCRHHHTLEQRACRLLLACMDAAGTNDLSLTHESMAQGLGVRRESVTVAVQGLTGAHVVSCGRGRISVADREALEARSCDCHAVFTGEVDALFQALRADVSGNALPMAPSEWPAERTVRRLQLEAAACAV